MSVKEQSILYELRKLTILTGMLSDVHQKTLKTAPFVFFDGLEKVEISHDINTESSGGLPGVSRIVYTLSFDENLDLKTDELLPKRLEALRKTAQAILWPEVVVSIFDKKGNNLG